MKAMMFAVLTATVLAAPALSFAQTTSGPVVTRAEVRKDLLQVEMAGYKPSRIDPNYPAIQAAEARVHADSMSRSAYGGAAAGGRSDVGVPAGPLQDHSI